jgi:hypothetical protein
MKVLMYIEPALAENSGVCFYPSIATYPSIKESLSAGLLLLRRFHMSENIPLHTVELNFRYLQHVSE